MNINFRGFLLKKCTAQFKPAVVLQYLGGEIGLKALAREHELGDSLIKRSVNLYKADGDAGLEKKFIRFGKTQKLEILWYLWAMELFCEQAACMFNIRSPILF
ncbi:hypothetical protein RGU70_05080 [Herbaspirillum sp. RTI4]|uniref:hypothetical protein n=1 Tax=Herbaspirillum sp. RTI4 TaxID=3048640 RepID=UPI002AB4FFFA|nr:hypothetical protein [Herbaspirillum sp. RTI4]MDY7577695.1 hypothetical protein [Herbaspirillum sp. RTI4]MEA9983470.1 hypothetical protein [Herbaspirillum sp. RTI4]